MAPGIRSSGACLGWVHDVQAVYFGSRHTRAFLALAAETYLPSCFGMVSGKTPDAHVTVPRSFRTVAVPEPFSQPPTCSRGQTLYKFQTDRMTHAPLSHTTLHVCIQASPKTLPCRRIPPLPLRLSPLPLFRAPDFSTPAHFRQCSESSSCWQDHEHPDDDRRQRSPPSYPSPAPLMTSPRSPEGRGGGGAAAVLTPGSRRSRHSTQRQTFSLSSSDSCPKEPGEQEARGGYDGVPPPSCLFPPNVSPVSRGRRRAPSVDRRRDSLAYSYAHDVAAAAAAAAATAAAPERGGPSSRSPVSIHRYGYRSPRFGVIDDGDSVSSSRGGGGGIGGGGDDRGGNSLGRPFSCALSRGGPAGVAAREGGGWTRPVLEGGSLRLAAGESCSFQNWNRNAFIFDSYEAQFPRRIGVRNGTQNPVVAPGVSPERVSIRLLPPVVIVRAYPSGLV